MPLNRRSVLHLMGLAPVAGLAVSVAPVVKHKRIPPAPRVWTKDLYRDAMFSTYDAVGNREDLSEIVYVVDAGGDLRGLDDAA